MSGYPGISNASGIESGRVMPHNSDAEEHLLSCILADGCDGAPVLAQARDAGINASSFYDPKHGIAYAGCERLIAAGTELSTWALTDELRTTHELELIGGPGFIVQISQLVPTTAQASHWIKKVQEQALLREIIRTSKENIEDCHNYTSGIDELAEGARAKLEQALGKAVTGKQRTSKFRERLAARRFNFATPPEEPTPRFLINGTAVCTPGNLTNIIAQAKAGKTALIAASISAAIVTYCGTKDRDTLGVSAGNPGKMKLIVIDTEQSRFDHDQLIRQALRRAGVEDLPPWLWAYGLAGFSAAELRQALAVFLAEAAADGGIFAIIIDGTADLVNDVNDAEECNAFVAQLHALAIEHRCPIINVVHENPGQDGGKMRGHLGSQLERKAESNLRLKKTEDVTVVFSEKMRKAPILEKHGPRFAWDNKAGMHGSVKSAGATKDDAKREKLRDLADAVFLAAAKAALTWSELRDGIGKFEGLGPSGAGKRFDAMKTFGVVKRDVVGLWRLTPVSNTPT